MAQLQVGDKVYVSSRHGQAIHTIDRVTEKTAFSGDWKYKREYTNSIQAIGVNIWSATTAKIATPELVKKVEERAAYAEAYTAVKNANIRHLTLDQLNAILNIIKPQTNGTI